MTKRQLIDEIIHINQTAEPGFLSHFEDQDLREYLDHLQTARAPRMVGEAGRYEKYFAARPVPPAEFGLGNAAVSTEIDAAERAALLAAQPPAEVDAEADEQAASAQPAAPAVAVASAPAAPKADQTPAQAIVAAEEDATEDIREEAECDPLDSDTDDDSAADEAEEPTTRRDSVTARIARAWRQAPQDAQDDAAASQLDVAAEAGPEDSDADSQMEDDPAPAPAASAVKGDSDQAEPAAVIAGGGKSEEPQNWLF